MNGTSDPSRIVRRDALLERLERLTPEIVALVAPAGFGKSTLARQYLENRAVSAVCDCAYTTDDIDLARRIVPALAEEQPEQRAALSQREFMLGDGSMSRSERAALALAAWREAPRPSTFLFENAEHVLASPSAREFFTRLLAERPAGRSVVLCSRENLRVHLTRFAAPHRIVTLRPEDLAFTRLELSGVFGAHGLDAATLDRIYEISQGWPIPVLFLVRLAADGEHHTVLERLGDVAFEELYEYVADQVLATLPRELTVELFAAACIPNATAVDIALATGDSEATRDLRAFAHGSPFVRATPDATFVVHPLMGAMLVQGALARRDALLEATAARYVERGDFLRATELHLARSNPEAAAEVLECVAVGRDRAPSMRYARLLSALERPLVRRYPTLWCCSALLQSFAANTAQLLEETGSLWSTLPPDTSIDKRYYVLATRILLLTYLGRFDEALKALERVSPRSQIPDPPETLQHGYSLYLHGTIVGRMGRLDEAELDLTLAWPLVEPMDVMASAVLLIRGSEVARARGQRDEERDFLEKSLDYARRSQLSNFVAFRLAEASFGAWLAGEDALAATYSMELERLVEVDGIRGFQFYAACIRQESLPAVCEADLARWTLVGHLIACTQRAGSSKALRHAKAACEIASSYPNPFLQTLSAIALAEVSPAERDERYEEATRLAGSVASAALRDAVAAAARGDAAAAGFLAPYLRRLRSSGDLLPGRLEISLIRGTVRARGVDIKLADRELELLYALARRRDLVTRDELGELLWPDRTEEAARNALNVHVHRLRSHLGDEGTIERTREGVRLCDEARVDLREIDRAVASRRSREIDDESARRAVHEIYAKLGEKRPARVLAWAWFEPIERHMTELRCELGQRLASYALRTGAVAEACELANEMIAYDPCDEAARTIVISAYLQSGDRAAALRAYRQYRDVLVKELQCEPSPTVAALLQMPVPSDVRDDGRAIR